MNGYWPFGLRYAVGAANDEREGDVNNNVNNYYTWVTYGLAHQTIGLRYVNTKAGDVGTGTSATLQQIDGNLHLHLGLANLILGYFKQFNVSGTTDMDQTNYLVEAMFEAIPKSLLLVGRFEYQHTRNISGSESGNANSLVMSGSYYLVPNVRFVAEYSRQKGEDVTPPNLTDEEKLELAVHLGF